MSVNNSPNMSYCTGVLQSNYYCMPVLLESCVLKLSQNVKCHYLGQLLS